MGRTKVPSSYYGETNQLVRFVWKYLWDWKNEKEVYSITGRFRVRTQSTLETEGKTRTRRLTPTSFLYVDVTDQWEI